jgi:hypothetical protein
MRKFKQKDVMAVPQCYVDQYPDGRFRWGHEKVREAVGPQDWRKVKHIPWNDELEWGDPNPPDASGYAKHGTNFLMVKPKWMIEDEQKAMDEEQERKIRRFDTETDRANALLKDSEHSVALATRQKAGSGGDAVEEMKKKLMKQLGEDGDGEEQ